MSQSTRSGPNQEVVAIARDVASGGEPKWYCRTLMPSSAHDVCDVVPPGSSWTLPPPSLQESRAPVWAPCTSPNEPTEEGHTPQLRRKYSSTGTSCQLQL